MIDIPSLQKRKFLNNVYKSLYAEGVEPDENEVRRLFSSYFTLNKLGSPVNINFGDLDRSNVIDVDILNQLMANSLLNLEILYDLVWENNNEILSVVTSLNNRLEHLRAKRKKVESTIDQLIFSNENSDGFFYSFLDSYSTVDNVDLNISTGYVDVLNGACKIPFITSDLSNSISNSQMTSTTASMSKIVNGEVVVENQVVSDIDLVFDGLTDTYWSTEVEASSPSVAAVELSIPLNSSYSVSDINFRLITSSPCSLGIRLSSGDASVKDVAILKDSVNDYDRFSFTVPPKRYESIKVTMFKYEPDEVRQGSVNPYRYRFGISEIMIGSQYHEKKAVIVSQPISLPTVDNKSLEINTVSLDAEVSRPDNSSVRFYVARDVDGATSVSDFNWQGIENTTSGNNSFPSSVSFLPTSLSTVYFNSPTSPFVPVVVDNSSANSNDSNPLPLPYATDKQVYRFKQVPETLNLISPFILSGLNSLRSYFQYSDSPTTLYKSVGYWLDTVANKTVSADFVKNQSIVIDTIRPSGSGFLTCKILCENDVSTIQTISKSSLDFNLSVYLNGNLIVDLPSGNKSQSVEWNFVKGVNNIQIGYDNLTNSNQTVSIMSGVNLSEYGTIYLDYYNYLDPIEFRRRPFESLNAFTVQDLYGQRQIISSKPIREDSLIRYYSNSDDVITSIRYRIDMFRGDNPLSSPSVEALRIKFKHNDS